MDLLFQVRQYSEYIKKNPYVYELQKQGIDLLIKFLSQYYEELEENILSQQIIDHFILLWIPKVKKYLTEIEAYNIIYTVQDLLVYLRKENKDRGESLEIPIVLEQYGKEYMRLYKARSLVNQLVGDPVICVQPLVVDMNIYREYKLKQTKKDNMSLYEKGWFKVEEVHKDGYIAFNRMGTDKQYRVLFTGKLLKNFKKGDITQMTLKKRIFFIYWEICELKGYYLGEAENYLSI